MPRQLCSAIYDAVHFAGQIIITATGMHFTNGYETFFEPRASRFHVTLRHSGPAPGALAVTTPFAVQYVIDDPTSQQSFVVVHDVDGDHRVRIRPVVEPMNVCRPSIDDDRTAVNVVETTALNYETTALNVQRDAPATRSIQTTFAHPQSPSTAWLAWHDHTAISPVRLHVRSEGVVGVNEKVMLYPRGQQGSNPRVYLLERVIRPGAPLPVHYTEVTDAEYDFVDIDGLRVPIYDLH